MTLLDFSKSCADISKQIDSLSEENEYYKRKLISASISLVLLSLNCPNIECAHKNGVVEKIKSAIEKGLIDISFSLPIIVASTVHNTNMKQIKSWSELINLLNEYDTITSK